MNFFANSQIFQSWISSLLKTIAIATGLASLVGCSSINIPSRTQNSSLPITVTHAISGTIASARTYETSDRLYVSGQVRHFRGYHLPLSAHVDIQLIGKDNRILAEKQDQIDLTAHARTNAWRNQRVSYVASFPVDLARRASAIHVTYHLETHSVDVRFGATSAR
jgi:hypothetical protein